MRGSIAGTAMLTAGCKPRACFAGRVEEGSELRFAGRVALRLDLRLALLLVPPSALCGTGTHVGLSTRLMVKSGAGAPLSWKS